MGTAEVATKPMLALKELVTLIKAGKVKSEKGFECPYCFNSGFKQVKDPQKGPNSGVVRCDKCKYWKFRQEF